MLKKKVHQPQPYLIDKSSSKIVNIKSEMKMYLHHLHLLL